jgi:hypothetical protein
MTSEPMMLLNSAMIDRIDLAWAIDKAFNPQVRTAARTIDLLAVSQQQLKDEAIWATSSRRKRLFGRRKFQLMDCFVANGRTHRRDTRY